MSGISKHDFATISFTPDYTFTKENVKSLVLNLLARKFSLTNEKDHILEALPECYSRAISSRTAIPRELVNSLLNDFFKQLRYHAKFMQEYHFKWEADPNKLFRRVRALLHRLHRIAPVFDYNRARANLKTLHKLCSIEAFWPQIPTQIAITIYITDYKNKNNEKLLQKNLRSLCGCSAYAFHRTRNILKLTKYL